MDITVEYWVVESFQVPVFLGVMFMKTHKFTVDLHSKQFWTKTESSATPLQLKRNKQIDALTMVDCRSQGDGVTPEADGCSGDKDFQHAYSTRKLVDEDYATIVELTAGKTTSEVKAKVANLVSELRDVFACSDSQVGARNRVYHNIDTGKTPPSKLPPHGVSAAKLPAVQHEMLDMLSRGIIQYSQSRYSAPMWCSRKKLAPTAFV